jgi:hypothetical protein
MKERNHLKYLGTVTWITLICIINKCEGVDWIHLGQDRNKWHGLVKKQLTFGFYKRRDISLAAE